MQVQPNQNSVQSLQQELICPVILKPLTEAVSLVPCAHKVQQTVAEKIYGETHGGWQVSSKELCPVCRAAVVGYMPDPTIRNMVKQFFELPEAEINAMLASVKNNLAEKSMPVEKKAIVEVPYPGESAEFVMIMDKWGLFDRGEDNALCRHLIFMSITKDISIEKFTVLGYKDGSVSIGLQFSSTKIEAIEQYLNQLGLKPNAFELGWIYESEGCDQLKVFFDILAKNNKIPSPYLELIGGVVEKGTHLLSN